MEFNTHTCFLFFLFSGRGAAYDELGSCGSDIGSHWLILEPHHVKRVINESTFFSRHFEFHVSLTEEEYNTVADSLINWKAEAAVNSPVRSSESRQIMSNLSRERVCLRVL